jgi:hypothetical protein
MYSQIPGPEDHIETKGRRRGARPTTTPKATQIFLSNGIKEAHKALKLAKSWNKPLAKA